MALASVLALLGTGEISLALPGPESDDYLDGGVDPAPRDRTSSPLLNRHYQGLAPNTAPPVSPTPGREIFERRFQIVYTAQVRQGLRIADFSPGTGDITVLFARAVGPEGRVYAVDPSPAGVARLQTLAQEYHVTNIEPILNPGEDTQLPPAGIDLAFLGDTAYGSGHGFDHGLADRSLLDSIRQALIPYGSLVVIGQRDLAAPRSRRSASPGRIDRERVVTAVQQAGFRLVEAPEFLRDHFFLRFEKLGDEPDIEVGPIESVAPTSDR